MHISEMPSGGHVGAAARTDLLTKLWLVFGCAKMARTRAGAATIHQCIVSSLAL